LEKFFQKRIDPNRENFSKGVNFPILGVFSVILISYFVQNLTVFDMVNSYLMFFLVLGFIASLAAPESAGFGGQESLASPKVGSLKKLLIVIILILFCFSFFKFVIQPLQADALVIKAIRSSDSTERVSLYKKTLDTSSLGKYQIREFFADTAIDFIRSEAAQEISLNDLKLELDFIKEELEKSTKESPLDFRAYLKLGRIYNIYGRIDPSKIPQAETVLEKAIELSPTNQQAYWELAQTRLYQGKFDEALSLAKRAVDLEPRVINSHLMLVQIAKISGNKELAEKKAEEAIKINPAWEPEFKKILEK
jgi:tetratricopeptide (TPR) repeat protein